MVDVEKINKMTLQEIGREIRKEEESPEWCMTKIQEGFLVILYEVEVDLLKGMSDPRFYEKARQTVRRTINEINEDIKK